MKKFYMTMAAMLCGVAAMAQGIGTLSCGDVEVTAGGETAYLEVKVSAEDVTAISGIQFSFGLPEGVSIAKVYNEDDEAWVDDVTFPIAKSKHQVGIMESVDGYMVYLGGESSLAFKTTTDVVAKIGIVAAKDAKNGTYAVNFIKAAMSDKSAVVKSYEVADFAANVTIKGGTGINSINAADSKAPVYNVAGQRVSKAQKGIFIQNGKKIAVK